MYFAILSETLIVTGPIFIIVLLGLTLKRIGFIDDHFNQIASKLVFSICLPVLLFTTISQIPLDDTLNLSLLQFSVIVAVGGFLLSWMGVLFVEPRIDRGVMVQGAFRSNLGVIGLALCVHGGLVGGKSALIPSPKLSSYRDSLAGILDSEIDGATPANIYADVDSHTAVVIVDEDQQSLAIGKRGQNARLASRLTGWQVNIEAKQSEAQTFEDKIAEVVKAFAEVPGITPEVAQVLVHSGFHALEDLTQVEESDLVGIEGIGDQAGAILQAVKSELEKRSQALTESAAG